MGEQLGLSGTCPHRTTGASRRHGAASFHLGDSRPVLTALDQVLAVLQQTQPKVAAQQRGQWASTPYPKCWHVIQTRAL